MADIHRIAASPMSVSWPVIFWAMLANVKWHTTQLKQVDVAGTHTAHAMCSFIWLQPSCTFLSHDIIRGYY